MMRFQLINKFKGTYNKRRKLKKRKPFVKVNIAHMMNLVNGRLN